MGPGVAKGLVLLPYRTCNQNIARVFSAMDTNNFSLVVITTIHGHVYNWTL